MNLRSWEQAGLDGRRAACFCVLTGTLVVAISVAATLPSIGPEAPVFGLVAGCAACYLAVSTPRRELEGSMLEQAREAPLLAASAAVYMDSTLSPAATLLMLRSEEELLSRSLREARRRLLLGGDPVRAVESTSQGLLSQSVSRLLRSVSRLQRERLEEDGEELETMTTTYALGEETKTPVFLAFSFFLPIMLLLFAAISHVESALAIAGLAVAELVVLDIALSFSSTEKRRLG